MTNPEFGYNPEANKEIERIEPVAKRLEEVFGAVYVEDLHGHDIYSTLPDEDYAEKSKAISKANTEIINKITEYLKSQVFPKTFEVQGYTPYSSKRHQSDLFMLGSVLLNRRINPEQIETDLVEAFKGKQVLVLGDDMGTLSETINRLGGTAFGIEYDDELVRVARSGKNAEDGLPQTQVIEGDVADLIDENSELFKKLKSLGAFDAIYSHAVFNSGSGIDNADRDYEPNSEGNHLEFTGSVFLHTDTLLKDDGFQVHGNIEDGFRLFEYGVRPKEETLKPILMQEGGRVRFHSRTGSHAKEAFISRKGLTKKLIEARETENRP